MSARPSPPILAMDRGLLLGGMRPLLDARGLRFFVTGGTGFVGSWILEALTASNDDLGLGLSATVLSRNPEAFRVGSPHLATHPSVRLLAGDVRSVELPASGFDFVIHGAFDSSRDVGPEETWSTIVEGTARCLELARRSGARGFLLLSSGAVYGRQPAGLAHMPEDYDGGPGLESLSLYGRAKRAGEALCLREAGTSGPEVKVARCFAFVGPHLPLDAHFAIGNFIGDALAGGPIRVRGDGTAIRSYLYAADLAVWLLTILFRGRAGAAYNVGSEREFRIVELARLVADLINPSLPVEVAAERSGLPADRYVPSTRKARDELGLGQTVPLEEAIRRTSRWFGSLGPGAEGFGRFMGPR